MAKGILTPEQSESMIAGAVVALLTLAWILWVKYGQRLKILAALAAEAGTTERQVERKIKAGDAPPATLRKDEAPR